MKGVVFVEFLKMVEAEHGLDMVDDIIEQADVPSGGAYTAVGTYDHKEMVDLVVSMSKITGVPTGELLSAFGSYLFSSLANAHPVFMDGARDALDFLEKVETYIHVEVRKLYPDAELPTFECERQPGGKVLHMIYSSSRHLEDVCDGLIQGCLKWFHSDAEVERQPLEGGRELFIIKTS
ncbi:heme NO-binding domain-containing protein [Persicirhabdus sediminis]|uniref:Heme NO-binding domain-containing protein n=1 Tax=Persicirhabdus sediminis TaxID=454144 RepID=A0A8J7SK41_9BACT|nr:heme NO-binding domain-containing protein [Persicirhabdus sediminis]MBK1790555.1 heme NO-binding domain-containing protein [Persicirhabdus sediminis]